MFQNTSYSNKTEDISIYYILSEVVGYYLIPIVNIISFVTNVLFCLIIYKLKNSSQFYNILLAKQIQDAMSAILGIGWQNFHCNFCEDQIYNSYFFFFYKIFLLRFPMSVLYFNSILFDILIMIERYGKIYSKKFYLIEKVPIKVISLVMTMIVIVLFIPDYFAVEIRPTDRDGVFSSGFSSIGQSSW